MQKHKLGVTCPGALFMEITLSSPEHEKLCVNVSYPGRTGMHYVARISHRMLKNKFSVKCPGVLLMETTPSPPEHEK
jgi:hypothetical protein